MQLQRGERQRREGPVRPRKRRRTRGRAPKRRIAAPAAAIPRFHPLASGRGARAAESRRKRTLCQLRELVGRRVDALANVGGYPRKVGPRARAAHLRRRAVGRCESRPVLQSQRAAGQAPRTRLVAAKSEAQTDADVTTASTAFAAARARTASLSRSYRLELFSDGKELGRPIECRHCEQESDRAGTQVAFGFASSTMRTPRQGTQRASAPRGPCGLPRRS